VEALVERADVVLAPVGGPVDGEPGRRPPAGGDGRDGQHVLPAVVPEPERNPAPQHLAVVVVDHGVDGRPEIVHHGPGEDGEHVVPPGVDADQPAPVSTVQGVAPADDQIVLQRVPVPPGRDPNDVGDLRTHRSQAYKHSEWAGAGARWDHEEGPGNRWRSHAPHGL
jgi:hypothetical protein